MNKIDLPKFIEQKLDDNTSKFVLEPLYPGYGATMGNALRRVLLSSITGAAATSFKVEGVSHEFSAISHAKEDVVELMMNLKSVNFKSFSDEPVILELSKKGPAVVTAKDFKANSKIEISNPDAHILTLDKGADLYLEVTVEKGRGFRSASLSESQKSEIGQINIDAVFSPIERVAIETENTRVGQMTNFDKLTLTVKTNGSIAAADAIKEAASILVDHYNVIISGGLTTEAAPEISDEFANTEIIDEIVESEDSIDSKTKIEDLGLSQRTTNALINAGIKSLGGLKRLAPVKVEEIKGLGKKGIEEIKQYIG